MIRNRTELAEDILVALCASGEKYEDIVGAAYFIADKAIAARSMKDMPSDPPPPRELPDTPDPVWYGPGTPDL